MNDLSTLLADLVAWDSARTYHVGYYAWNNGEALRSSYEVSVSPGYDGSKAQIFYASTVPELRAQCASVPGGLTARPAASPDLSTDSAR